MGKIFLFFFSFFFCLGGWRFGLVHPVQKQKPISSSVVVGLSRAKKKKKSEIRDILNSLIGSNWIDSSKYFWFFLTFFFLLGGSRFVWMHPVHTHKPTSPGVVVGMSWARARD